MKCPHCGKDIDVSTNPSADLTMFIEKHLIDNKYMKKGKPEMATVLASVRKTISVRLGIRIGARGNIFGPVEYEQAKALVKEMFPERSN